MPNTTATDDILKFHLYFPEEISHEISCESPSRQTIHMKYQVLFSLKNNNNKFRISSFASLFSTLGFTGL